MNRKTKWITLLCAVLIGALVLPIAVPQVMSVASAASGTAVPGSANKAPNSISVKGKSTIQKGKTVTFTVKVKPSGANKDVTWSSSNPKVATVNSKGEVTGKKAGTATITAVSKSNSKVKGTYKVTVSDKRAESVEITNAPATMNKGSTVTLKAKAHPSKAPQEFEWSSSDESILKVTSDGKVTAKKAGVAKIKAKATDGSKKKASVTIRVIDATTEKNRLKVYLSKAQSSGEISWYSGGGGKIAAVVYTGTNTSSLTPTVSYLSPNNSYFSKMNKSRMADCLDNADLLLIVFPDYYRSGSYTSTSGVLGGYGYQTYTMAAIVDLHSGSVVYKAKVATTDPPSRVYAYGNYYGSFEANSGMTHLLNKVQ